MTMSLLRLSSGTRSACACSYQSTSPFCNAADAVAASGMIFHSIRWKLAILPPEVHSAGSWRGT